MDATAIRSLVLRSGQAKYFRCIERTEEAATFETQRGDDPPVRLRYTVEEARRSWVAKHGDSKESLAKFDRSGWGVNKPDMCVARAGSKLARLVYPDICLGLYDKDEFD